MVIIRGYGVLLQNPHQNDINSPIRECRTQNVPVSTANSRNKAVQIFEIFFIVERIVSILAEEI